MFSRLRSLLFFNRSTRQTVVKNIFWLGVSQIGSRLIRAVIIIYAARVLGAAEYGVFSYVLGFAGFFTIFADIGITPLLTREIASTPDPHTRLRYFSTSFWLKLILLFFTALLIIFVAPHLTNIEAAALLIPLVALLTIFDGLRELAIAYVRGREKMEWEAAITTFMNIAIMVAGILILQFYVTAHALLLSYIASVGAALIFSIILLRKEFASIFHKIDFVLARRILSSSWPIAFYGVLGAFMLNTDVIMLGWWRTSEEIGYYSASQRIIQVFYTIPALLASGLFPFLARLIAQGDLLKARSLHERSITLALSLAIPLVIGGIILASPLVALLYGAEYLPAAPSLQILLITLLFIFPGILLGNIILAHNKQRETILYIGLGAIGNIVFNFFFIPLYGIVGAAIATIIAQVLNTGLTWRKVKQLNNFTTLPHIQKITAAAVIMGSWTYFLNLFSVNVFLIISTSILVYVGLLFIFREKIINEVKDILRPLRQ